MSSSNNLGQITIQITVYCEIYDMEYFSSLDSNIQWVSKVFGTFEFLIFLKKYLVNLNEISTQPLNSHYPSNVKRELKFRKWTRSYSQKTIISMCKSIWYVVKIHC